MINFKSDKGTHVVTVNGIPRVFPTLLNALKYIASRY